MIWKETRLNIHDVYLLLLKSLKEKYDYKEDADGIQFRNMRGIPFNVSVMGDSEPWNFVVVEYEDTGEDGDGYYPEDFDSYDDLLQAMIKEIEG